MTDVRYKKTQNRIKKSLINLLKTHDYDKINVSMISEHSGINRVTFYTHYNDKEDLLRDIVNDFVVEGAKQALELAQTRFANKENNLKLALSISVAFVEYCDSNRSFLEVLSKTENRTINYYFNSSLSNQLIDLSKKLEVKKFNNAYNYTLDFLIAGYSKIILGWLVNPQCSKTELIDYIIKLTTNIINSNIVLEYE